MKIIDINCDMGENKGDDKLVIKYISSANIACGGHAGDSYTIRKSIYISKLNQVNAGAHPGYADKWNFGRIETGQTYQEIIDSLLVQLDMFMTEASRENTSLSHIKLHGALYNRASSDYELMFNLVSDITSEFGNIPFYTLFGSVSEKAVLDAGGVYFSEGFADRAYDGSGRLIPRGISGAVLNDGIHIANRVLDMVQSGKMISIDGQELPASLDTICVHGDTPDAVLMVQAIKAILNENNITVGRRDAF